MQNVIANEQAFQSIYLDPQAEKWSDRIVFHEPIFEDEMPGVIALKSLDLEDLIGLVVAAPLNVLRHFREQVKESDLKEKWGQEDPSVIVAKLVKLAKELGAVISYEQLGQEVTKQREVGTEEDEAMFFDPATQRQIVKKGVHYFDPSLPTVKDVEDLQSKRQAEGHKQPVNPGIGAYPQNITEEGKSVWDKLMSDHQHKVFKYARPKRRWEFAEYLYDLACIQKGVNPFVLQPENKPSAVLKKLKSSHKQIQDVLRAVLVSFTKRNLLQGKLKNEKVRDARRMDNVYVLTTESQLDLEGLGTVQQVVKHLTDHHNFIATDDVHCFKVVNPNTQLVFARNPKNMRKVSVYKIFRIPEKDAIMVTKSKKEKAVLHRLTKMLDLWVKSGRFA